MENMGDIDFEKLFNERKRSSMKATPYVLFFLHKGKEFALRESTKIGGQKPKVSDFIMVLQHEWSILSDENKTIYLNAAIRLGYTERESFIDKNGLRDKIRNKINSNFFNFF